MSIDISGVEKLSGVEIITDFSALPSDYSSAWKMGLRFTQNDPAQVLLNGGNIETAYDITGNGRHFTQAVAGFRPAFSLGNGGVFNDDFLECASPLINDSVGTLFFALRFDRANTDEYIFSKANAAVGDGDGFSVMKTSGNLKRSILAVGTQTGIQGNVQVTDTSTFRVYAFQKNRIYQNSIDEDIINVAPGGTNLWFNTPSGATRMCIGKRAGNIASYGRFTMMFMDFYDVTFPGQDIIKLMAGYRLTNGI